MTIPEWKEILQKYRSYGINCVRFHSHCEPEAAFAAADELGMLSAAGTVKLESERCLCNRRKLSAIIVRSLQTILKTYANHPSFVMLTLGNELQAQR